MTTLTDTPGHYRRTWPSRNSRSKAHFLARVFNDRRLWAGDRSLIEQFDIERRMHSR